jgi:pyruvate kinase
MQTANELNAKAIIAPTISGATARFIASFRPMVPVIAVTPSPMVQRQLCMHWGTYPLLTRRLSNTDEVVNDAINVAQEAGLVLPGDTVVLTAGVVGSVRNATNLMMVRTIERVLARGTGLGQREIAGRIVSITTPVNGMSPSIGPQDIIFASNVDRASLRLLQRAGGLITPDPGLDSYGAVAAVELGIPAIIGAQGDLEALVDGKSVILDATTGQVIEWKK